MDTSLNLTFFPSLFLYTPCPFHSGFDIALPNQIGLSSSSCASNSTKSPTANSEAVVFLSLVDFRTTAATSGPAVFGAIHLLERIHIVVQSYVTASILDDIPCLCCKAAGRTAWPPICSTSIRAVLLLGQAGVLHGAAEFEVRYMPAKGKWRCPVSNCPQEWEGAGCSTDNNVWSILPSATRRTCSK